MRALCVTLGLILALAHSAPSQEPENPASQFQLDNGLTAIIRPVQGADQTCLLLLYRIGGDHDPEGHSGLAHLIEHFYVTSAAGTQAARTAEQFFGKYRSGCNAQTGDRYTVIATVFPKEQLDSELAEAADRMNRLQVAPADLDRERPRLLEEVANMFGRMPQLGALNQAHELIRPSPRGGRRGGVPAQVSALTLAEIRERIDRYYKPVNALVVVAGAVEPQAGRKAIESHFAKLPSGSAIPPAGTAGPPKFGVVVEDVVNPIIPTSRPVACLAYAVPAPDSALYAPFLVLLARISTHASELGEASQRPSLVYPLLEDPAVVSLSVPLTGKDLPKDQIARAEAALTQILSQKLGPNELSTASQFYALFLGTSDLPDAAVAQNPYAVALSLGRRVQLGIVPEKLKASLARVTDDELRRVAESVFGPDRHATAILSIRGD